MSYPFELYTPTRVVFGRDAEDRTGELVRGCGAGKVLLHYGKESAVRSGLVGRIEASLDAAGVAHVSLGGVVPNPRLSKVREGIALGRAEGVDFILAVGGGSAIDSAKAIAYGLAEPEKDVWELFTQVRKPAACLPVGCVLTIAASGSETSNSCVITDWENGLKRSCNNNLARPRFAVMDPALTLTLPDYQTQAGCADIMMHTMERYFTQGGNLELTDELAEGLLRTVMKNAELLKKDPDNYEARAEVMWAGSLSHNGLTGCGTDGGDFACHGLEHELSGMFDVTHGAGLTAVWPAWARYVYRDCLHRFVRFAVKVTGVAPRETDEATALAGIAAMEAFYHRIGMPATLRELGIDPTDDQLRQMAASCAQAAGGVKGSAKKLRQADMEAIYFAARG